MSKKAYKFNKTFDKTSVVFSKQVMISLMGSYTEHTGGNKLHCMINNRISARVNRIIQRKLNLFLDNEEIQVHYDDIEKNDDKTLNNLIKIIIAELTRNGITLNVGIEGYVESIDKHSGIDLIPTYITLFVDILTIYNRVHLDKEKVIEVSNNILNEYRKTNVAKESSIFNCYNKQCIYQNTRKNILKHMDINFNDFSIVICYDNSVSNELSSLYKSRVDETISAHMIIDSKFKYDYLSDAKIQEINEIKQDIRDVEFRRIRHAITESARVDEIYDAITNDDIVKVGLLLSQSHYSITQDYEVTTEQQNSMFSLVNNWNILGAKMIESEYNSSILVLVKNIQIPAMIEEVSQFYKEKFKSQIEFIVSEIK